MFGPLLLLRSSSSKEVQVDSVEQQAKWETAEIELLLQLCKAKALSWSAICERLGKTSKECASELKALQRSDLELSDVCTFYCVEFLHHADKLAAETTAITTGWTHWRKCNSYAVSTTMACSAYCQIPIVIVSSLQVHRLIIAVLMFPPSVGVASWQRIADYVGYDATAAQCRTKWCYLNSYNRLSSAVTATEAWEDMQVRFRTALFLFVFCDKRTLCMLRPKHSSHRCKT